jgi:hypothetical protein
MLPDNPLLSTPSALRVEHSRMSHYMRWLEREKGQKFSDYNALWHWSVDHLKDFWESIWQYFEIRNSALYTRILSSRKIPDAKWFEGARLNLAEQIFRFHDDEEAGSGADGMPKPIVHGHGGILLESMKSNALHFDLGFKDHFHWHSTTGHGMWSKQVSGLLVRATICIYDGNPVYPDAGTLWKFAEQAGVTFLGADAGYYCNCMRLGLEPARIADLHRLRSLGSTGSPLAADGYAWIYQHLGLDLMLAEVSGGSEVASFFVGPCPILSQYSGEIQCRCLSVAVRALDDQGVELIDAAGELVATEAMPSMPLYFWSNADGARHRDAMSNPRSLNYFIELAELRKSDAVAAAA